MVLDGIKGDKIVRYLAIKPVCMYNLHKSEYNTKYT